MLTIAIPALNAEERISDLLDSLSVQTRGDFKVLISDNASSDNTNEVCNLHARSDDRITVIRQPEQLTMREHHRFLLNNVETEYITWPGDDDTFEVNWVEETMGVIEQIHDINVVCTNIQYKRGDGETTVTNTVDLCEDVCQRMRNLTSVINHNTVWLTWHGLWRTSYLQNVFFRLTDVYRLENLICTDNLLHYRAVFDNRVHFVCKPLFIKRLLPEKISHRTYSSYGVRYKHSQMISAQGLEYLNEIIQSSGYSDEEKTHLTYTAAKWASTSFGSASRLQKLKWGLLPWYRKKMNR